MKQNVSKCNMMITASSKFGYATSIFVPQRCWFVSIRQALWILLCVEANFDTEFRWLYSGARSCLK
jgi:hypothetical protein